MGITAWPRRQRIGASLGVAGMGHHPAFDGPKRPCPTHTPIRQFGPSSSIAPPERQARPRESCRQSENRFRNAADKLCHVFHGRRAPSSGRVSISGSSANLSQ